MYSQEPLDGQTVLVVGPGWLGGAAASALASLGARVWTLQRSPAVGPGGSATPEGRSTVAALTGDIRLPGESAPWMSALPAAIDHVVVCIAPSRSAGDSYLTTYPTAVAGSLAFARARASRSIVYTSSTGIYARTDGGFSFEGNTIIARDERQDALQQAEDVLRMQSSDGSSIERSGETVVGRTILRVAGLYGPGRDPGPRFSGTIPSGAADVWCNFAWRDDVVDAITHVIRHPSAPGTSRVFNCADGVPLRASTIARALGATQLGPPASSAVGRSNQRISVDALRYTGWKPQMATVLDGLAALGHRVDRSVVPAS